MQCSNVSIKCLYFKLIKWIINMCLHCTLVFWKNSLSIDMHFSKCLLVTYSVASVVICSWQQLRPVCCAVSRLTAQHLMQADRQNNFPILALVPAITKRHTYCLPDISNLYLSLQSSHLGAYCSKDIFEGIGKELVSSFTSCWTEQVISETSLSRQSLALVLTTQKPDTKKENKTQN